MAHQRQTIREAIKTALVGTGPSYATSAGVRVYETRALPIRRLELPAIAVYTTDETSSDNDTAPRRLTRTVDLLIEASVQAGSNVDDSMDAICVQIERAMHADETFGAVCMDSTLVNTKTEVFEEGQQLFGVATLTYSVTYETSAPDADDVTELDDLSTVTVEYNLSGDQDEDDTADDLIEDLEV